MSSVNKVVLIGHLGRDPESRTTSSGSLVVTFSVATSESWRDKATGERKEKTEWHNVVIFNENLAKVAQQYLKKGSKAYVEGKMRTREYTDRDGAQRRTTEIVLENFRGELVLLDRAERQAPDPDSYGTTRSRDDSAGRGRPAPLDDDIPF